MTRADRWAQFAAAALSGLDLSYDHTFAVETAARRADAMMAAFEKRFPAAVAAVEISPLRIGKRAGEGDCG
jgi:hypothetical protein